MDQLEIKDKRELLKELVKPILDLVPTYKSKFHENGVILEAQYTRMTPLKTINRWIYFGFGKEDDSYKPILIDISWAGKKAKPIVKASRPDVDYSRLWVGIKTSDDNYGGILHSNTIELSNPNYAKEVAAVILEKLRK